MPLPIVHRAVSDARATLLLCALAVATLAPARLRAQDTTTRGVRIGLAYDPGSKPGVVILPVAGVQGDSVRAIVARDLDNGDRVTVVQLDLEGMRTAVRGGPPNWPLLARLGAAAAVQVTPTPTGLHLAVYNVATRQTALIRDYAAPSTSDARGWRAVVHGLSDDLEESFTGTRGIARTRVLFERGRRIWIADSDGEQAMPVSDAATAASAAWHPSGQSFAFSTYVPSQIVLQELGGRARVVAGGAGVYISPVFSPDGASVVYAHGVDAGVDLYTAPVSGGAGRRLSVGRGSDNVSPSFSPDGRRIVFMSGRAGHPEIYTMDADGTNVDLLTPLDLGESAYRASPDWSPDGRLVAFQSRVAGSFQLMTVNLRDRSLRQLTNDGRNEDPSWAPDGRHLVFTSDRSGSRQLWVMDAESGRTRQLTHGPASRTPAWSPRLGS
jgi:TolB protein